MEKMDLSKEFKEVKLTAEETKMVEQLEECVAGGNCGGNHAQGCWCMN